MKCFCILWILLKLKMKGGSVKTSFLKLRVLVVFAVIGICFGLDAQDAKKAKYVFLMIGDGMGVNQRESAIEYLKSTENKSLVMESFPVKNFTTTSSLSGTTDSAAAGTALACGVKTKNGMLGVTPDGKSVYSVAADAKAKGFNVAIMTDVPINHATPAAFYAHCTGRGSYSEITQFLPKSKFDIFVGDKFLVSKDEKAPDAFLKEKGYGIINSFDEFSKLGKDSSRNIFIMTIPLAIDDSVPRKVTLSEALKKTVELVESDNGFFIMLEGGRIDWCCHDNDFAAAIKEVFAFDEAVKTAKDFYLKHPEDTLIVVTADHETGGLSLNLTENINKAVKAQKCSKGKMLKTVNAMKKEKASFETVLAKMEELFGLKDLTDSEKESIKKAYDVFMGNNAADTRPEEIKKMYGGKNPLVQACSDIADRRAGVNWTSGSHSNSKVRTTAIGAGSENFNHDMDNTDIPKTIKKVMGL